MKQPFFSGHYYCGILWFRIYGYGLHIRPSKNFVPYFSERNGYTKAYYIGPVRLEILKPGE